MAANKAKSKIPGMCLALSTGLVRTIGIARAKAKIGLIKLVFNIRRLVTLEKWPPPGRRTSTKPEKIVAKLRQVDVLTAQGKSVADAIRSIGVTEVVPL